MGVTFASVLLLQALLADVPVRDVLRASGEGGNSRTDAPIPLRAVPAARPRRLVIKGREVFEPEAPGNPIILRGFNLMHVTCLMPGLGTGCDRYLA